MARNIPEKIRDFLIDRRGKSYCDECIQERLGLRWRQQVQVIAATLAVTENFARDVGDCAVCGKGKHVTKALVRATSTITLLSERRMSCDAA